MTKKKKILISGLLGAKGGRELEAAFIAQILEKEYDVTLLSTINVHPDSDIYAFNFKGRVDSLNMLLYRTNLLVRCTTYLMYAFRKKIRANHYHVSNKLTRNVMDMDAVKKRTIAKYIKSFDAIIICAQLHSQQMDSLVSSAKEEQIPTIFRTTGSINLSAVQQHEWLYGVTHFIHHSEENAKKLNNIKNHKYTIIDQCAFQESALLKVSLVSEKVTKFFCLGRLDENKNIDSVIRAFQQLLNLDITLTIVGDGHDKKKLQVLASSDSRIVFKPAIKHDDIVACYKNHHCLIIASHLESGPLTGIEAMAAGRVIVSTKVGAMPERLPQHPFWFDGTSESLIVTLTDLVQRNSDEISDLADYGRERYLEKFSKEQIKKQYLTVVEAIV